MGIRAQGSLNVSFFLSRFFLYRRDRGWLELLGGQGVWRANKSFVGFSQIYLQNSFLVFFSFVLFFVVFFILLLVLFVRSVRV